MAMEYGRSDRISSLVRRELAILITREMQDPRTQHTSVTAVELSRDKSTARVFIITAQPGPEKHAEVVQVLNKAAGFLRKKLGERVHLKRIPKLVFVYDESIEHGARLSALIDELSHQSGTDEN